MDFKLQALGPFLHWLTLLVLCVIPIVAGYVIYRLGRLPGAIARSRNHPQADAVAVCGWMGILTLVLWPLALVWPISNRPSRSVAVQPARGTTMR